MTAEVVTTPGENTSVGDAEFPPGIDLAAYVNSHGFDLPGVSDLDPNVVELHNAMVTLGGGIGSLTGANPDDPDIQSGVPNVKDPSRGGGIDV